MAVNDGKSDVRRFMKPQSLTTQNRRFKPLYCPEPEGCELVLCYRVNSKRIICSLFFSEFTNGHCKENFRVEF